MEGCCHSRELLRGAALVRGHAVPTQPVQEGNVPCRGGSRRYLQQTGSQLGRSGEERLQGKLFQGVDHRDDECCNIVKSERDPAQGEVLPSKSLRHHGWTALHIDRVCRLPVHLKMGPLPFVPGVGIGCGGGTGAGVGWLLLIILYICGAQSQLGVIVT